MGSGVGWSQKDRTEASLLLPPVPVAWLPRLLLHTALPLSSQCTSPPSQAWWNSSSQFQNFPEA